MPRRPHLSQVTLVAVSSVALDATVAALRHSMSQVHFAHALLLSDRQPAAMAGSGIEWRAIAPLRSRRDYSQFMLHGLVDHVQTSHALIVQWDGFVRDGRRWCDDFLDYDFIGAPWPQYDMAIGNGGFSLRSRRLLQATTTLPPASEPEDVMVCRLYRRHLEINHEIRFASTRTARRFSYERGRSDGQEFGFHGVFNFPAELPESNVLSILSSLEPGVIGARESDETLAKALRERKLALLKIALKHHRHHPHRGRRLLRTLGWLLRGHDGAPSRNAEWH